MDLYRFVVLFSMENDPFRIPLTAFPHHHRYTWTKSLGEELLESERGSIPCCVVRPSIVTSSWKEQPGWVEGIQGITGGIVGGGTGLLRSIWGNPDIIADIIPVDIVVNCTLAAAWRTYRLSPNYSSMSMSNNSSTEVNVNATPALAIDEDHIEDGHIMDGNESTRHIPLIHPSLHEDTHSVISNTASTSSDTVVDDMTPMLIYHCTSGKIKPITWGQFLCTNMLEAKKHVTYYPEIRKPRFQIHKSQLINNIHEFWGHKVFGSIIDPLLILSGRKPMLQKTYAKVGALFR